MNYQTSMTLQASANANVPPFVRLANVGDPADATQYVDFFADAQTPGTTRLGIGSDPATYSVDFTKYKLHFTGDQVPAPPLSSAPDPGIPVKGPAGPILPVKTSPALPKPVIPVYLDADGKPLAVQKNAQGQITGFSGTAASKTAYTLAVQSSSYKAPGRLSGPASSYPTWANMTATFSQQDGSGKTLEPFILAMSYCPLDNLAAIGLTRQFGNLVVFMALDLGQLLSDKDGSINGYAGLTRGINYYLKNFGTDQSQMPCGNTTSDMYLPAYVSMWTVQDMLWYFDDALNTVVNSLDLPPPANAPLMNIGEIQHTMEWAAIPTLANFLSTSLPLFGNAIGPLISAFISPNDPMDPINRLAYWFGWEFSSGFGQAPLTAALTDYYKQTVAFRSQGGGAGHPTILKTSPVSPSDGMIDRINSALFGEKFPG